MGFKRQLNDKYIISKKYKKVKQKNNMTIE